MTNKLARLIAKTKLGLKRNSSHILTGSGVFGMAVSLYLAVKNTPWALELIEERKKELGVSELSFVEKVKTVWRCYVSSGLTFALSSASLITADVKNTKRNAKLATMCSMSETALFNLNRQLDEVLGKKKAGEVRAAVAEERVKDRPPVKSEVIFTSKGDTLCFDAVSGRYFNSDIEVIRSAINRLNMRLMNEMYIPLNDYYSEIHMDDISVGDEMGWNVEHGLIEASFSTILTNETPQRPCLVVDFLIQPRYDFRNLH